MHIATIVGARPQFIKAAIVSRALLSHSHGARETIVHTGQHYDANMSDVFFKELSLPSPACHLGIGGGTHGQNTGRMLEAVEGALLELKPDWVLVYGDTDSTLAGALSAAKLNIPVAHVEAGLRSFNRRMPEELNRVLTDHASSLLLTPTAAATRNLAKEGISNKIVQQVGDVMYDAALYYRDRSRRPKELTLKSGFILSTIHRAENTGHPKRLADIVGALNDLAAKDPVLMPLHPRTRKAIGQYAVDTSNIILLEPVSYLQMIWLLQNCDLVVTDSGGLQKEAYFFGKHCIIARDETEWTELVETGWATLVGGGRHDLMRACEQAAVHARQATGRHLYGDGNAGEKIVKALVG